MTRPGGLIAVRDGDYGVDVLVPGERRPDRWLELYRAVARSNDAEPDAGRELLAWAHAAGFTDVTPSAGVWCYADRDGPGLVVGPVGRPDHPVRARRPGGRCAG